MGGSVDKVVDQNFSLIFHWANCTLNKPPIFYFPLFLTRQTTPFENFRPPYFHFPLFQSTSLTKLFPYFLHPLFFHFPSIKTYRALFFNLHHYQNFLPRGGRNPKWRGKLKSEIGGEPEPKTGGEVALDFDFSFAGTEATVYS